MAKEKMLVCNALDERDLLRKRIIQAIGSLKLITVKRKKDERVSGGKSVEDFKSEAQASFQSVVDLIDRYRRLDTAITLANAQTFIETDSGKKMTRAEAISLRKNILNKGTASTDFDGMLLSTMKNALDRANLEYANLNAQADRQVDTMLTAAVGKDSNKSNMEESIESIKKFLSDTYAEVIDPIGLQKKYDEMSSNYNTLVKELETAIKVSNATTYVEF